MPTTSPTKPSTPRLSEAARHVVFPSDIAATGWPHVVAECRRWGVGFDPWQDGVGRIALGKRADGKYAATVGGVVLSIPRQVGKTFLIGCIVVALCILNPGLKVVWTAHRTRTATNTFQTLQGICRKRRVAPKVLSVRTANGEQEIRFRNGAVILFGAREQGFGRGFDELDIEVFDEAQILTEKALEDMVPAANQSRHPSGALLFFMGTPPRPADPGEEFTNRRGKALSGKSEGMAYVEFSADQNADPDDREQWSKANPSFPSRTPVESMERMREQLTDEDSFMREALGIWDAQASSGVIPPQSWQAQADPESVPVDSFALGVEVGPDLAWASVALAGVREDSGRHVALEEDQHTKGRGVAWLEPHVDALVRANPQIRSVVVDVGGPVAPLLVEWRGRWFFKRPDGSRGVEVTALKVADLGAGCTSLLSGIVTGDVWHIDQPQLSVAALAATKRPLGDSGKWVWHRRAADSDITPIQAATYALIGADMDKPSRPATARSDSDGSVVIL